MCFYLQILQISDYLQAWQPHNFTTYLFRMVGGPKQKYDLLIFDELNKSKTEATTTGDRNQLEFRWFYNELKRQKTEATTTSAPKNKNFQILE